jgi:uncharacterized DUF497 family protein
MRFKFDKIKSQQLRNDPRRKIGFEEARKLFKSVFIEDQHVDFPHQWRATGWVGGELYTVVYEERNDKDGQYYHLVTLWKATKKERLIYEENT